MKKLFVLLVLVAAMVAAPVFAEITDTAWEGDFRFKMGGDFDAYADSTTDQDLDLVLTAAVGEFTTFDAGFTADPETDGDLSTAGVVTSDHISMTQDFGAMYGLDITLTLTAGAMDWDPTEYNNVYEWDFDGMDKFNSFKVVAGSGDVTGTVFLPMEKVVTAMEQFAGEVEYATDDISVAVNYVKDVDAEDGTLGANAKAVVADGTVFAQVAQDLDAEMTQVLVGVSYDLSPITVGADFGGSDSDALSFSDSMFIAFGVDYAATEVVTLKAGGLIPLKDTGDLYVIDAGADIDVDSVTYTLGFSYGVDTSTSDWTYVAPYSCNSGDFKEDYAVSFQMDVDF